MSTGIRYIITASFLFSLVQLTVKLLEGIPTHEIVFFRSIISLILCIGFIHRSGGGYLGNNKPLLLARGFVGAIALYAYFYTISKMPLATAMSIHYLSPIFTIIIAGFVMKEPATKLQWIFFITAFIGVVMIKGFDYRVSMIELSIGVGSAMLAGLAYNIVRKLKHTEKPLTVILYFPLVTLPIFTPYTISTWVWPSKFQLALLITLGLLTQAAQYALTRAYQLEKASNVAIFNYLGVIYAIMFGYFIFNETLQPLSIFGIVLLISSAIASVLLKPKTKVN